VRGATGAVLEDIVLVDELVTGSTIVTLELLLKLEVVEIIENLETGTVVLSFELVTTAEELVAEGMVLEDETEVVELTDESVTGRTIFELDELLRLDLVEMTDEFEIGYKTLLERILLLEPEIRLVTISAELVDTPGLADEDGLVDTERIVDTESRVEEDADADGLINADSLRVETAGLKMTVAKMIPEASRRLDRSN
jgi:hypothetical protein